MNDLVSVIMPSYNTADRISDSIKSVLAQTYKNLELIIVDDCSNDNTDEVVASFTDDRICYYKNDKNSGAAVSRHLSVLKDADLIRDERDGKYIYYELNASVLEEIMLWITELKGDNDND